MKIRRTHWLLALALTLAASSNAYAKITIDPGFTGTILVTTPTGAVMLVDSANEVPEIPSGSVLDAIDSSFVVKTEGGDSVSVGCLGNTVNVAGGGSAGITCSSEGGKVKALKGDIQVVDSSGKTLTVPEGTEQILEVSLLAAAPATADIPSAGGTPAGGDLAGGPEVDSRSIESSPSR